MKIDELTQYAIDQGKWDTLEFVLINKRGVPVPCKFLDAYLGMILVNTNLPKPGMITVGQFKELSDNSELELLS